MNEDRWFGAASQVAVVALAKVCTRVFPTGLATFTVRQYPTPARVSEPSPKTGIYSPGNHSAISRCADSAESEP